MKRYSAARFSKVSRQVQAQAERSDEKHRREARRLAAEALARMVAAEKDKEAQS